jgi:hypothetical protein
MYSRGIARVAVAMLKGGLFGAAGLGAIGFMLAGPDGVLNGVLLGGSFGLMGGALSLLGRFFSHDPEDEHPLGPPVGRYDDRDRPR